MAARTKKQEKSNPGNEQTPENTTSGGSVEQVQAQSVEQVQEQPVQEQLSEAFGSVQQKAGQIIKPIKSLALSQLDNQKEHIINRLFSVSVAIRQFDDQLRQQDQQTFAQYGDTAARQLERVTTYLRDKNTTDLVQEAGSFAKRNPLIVVGGALALGLLGARLIKSSGGQRQQQQSTNGAAHSASTINASADGAS